MAGRLDTLDIVFHLATIGSAQADDSSHLATINKGHVVEDPGLRRERNHAPLVVLDTVINPNQRSIPIEFFRQGRGAFRSYEASRSLTPLVAETLP